MNDMKLSDEFQAGSLFLKLAGFSKQHFGHKLYEGVKLTHTHLKPYHIFFLHFNLMLRVGTYNDQKLSDDCKPVYFSISLHNFSYNFYEGVK